MAEKLEKFECKYMKVGTRHLFSYLWSKPSFRLPLINYLYAANCLISSNFSAKRINRPKPTKIHSWQMIPICKRSYVNKMRMNKYLVFGVILPKSF